MRQNSREIWNEDFKKCVDFHGHACPGLAMGYVAAKAGMARLDEKKAGDEEVVAIVETDACGVDAVQVLTGCTFGKGNLIFKDYGKTAFSFLSRASGKGVRFSLKPGIFSLTPEHRNLFEKIWNDTATGKERELFQNLHKQKTQDVLSRPADGLFTCREITVSLPPRARVFDSLICDRCGEPVMASRVDRNADGLLLCRSCEEREG